MLECRAEIQGQNFKFLFTITEVVLGGTREKVCFFKDLEAIMVFVHSFGALTKSQRSHVLFYKTKHSVL